MRQSKFVKFMRKAAAISIPLLMGAVMGFFIGLAITKLMGDRPLGQSLAVLGGIGLFLCVMFFFHTIAHEVGHLLCGLATGYHFSSFRIGNIMFLSQNGKLVRKRFNVVGTGGQCLLAPPTPVNGQFPYLLYNLGGPLINLLLSGVFMGLYALFSGAHLLAALLCAVAAGAGIIMCLANLIPMRIGGIANDGYNTLMLARHPASRHAFWLQLETNARAAQGQRLCTMPAEWFDVPLPAPKDDALVCTLSVLRFSYLFDCRSFAAAEALAQELVSGPNRLLELQKNELRCELMFLALLRGDAQQAEVLYTPELQKYIRATQRYVSRQRLLYARARLGAQDEAAAQKVLAAFEAAARVFPFEGETAVERGLLQLVDAAAARPPAQNIEV